VCFFRIDNFSLQDGNRANFRNAVVLINPDVDKAQNNCFKQYIYTHVSCILCLVFFTPCSANSNTTELSHIRCKKFKLQKPGEDKAIPVTGREGP
jgi:hypothetical protein